MASTSKSGYGYNPLAPAPSLIPTGSAVTPYSAPAPSWTPNSGSVISSGNTIVPVWTTIISENAILAGRNPDVTVGDLLDQIDHLLERIEVLENVVLVSDSGDLHPIHIKKLAEKINILKVKIIEKNKLSDDDLFIHPMYILVEQIEHKIKSSNEVTLDQLNELNKIFESL